MNREKCSCCGLPTLEQLNYDEICELCKKFLVVQVENILLQRLDGILKKSLVCTQPTYSEAKIELHAFLELDNYENHTVGYQEHWVKIRVIEIALRLGYKLKFN